MIEFLSEPMAGKWVVNYKAGGQPLNLININGNNKGASSAPPNTITMANN